MIHAFMLPLIYFASWLTAVAFVSFAIWFVGASTQTRLSHLMAAVCFSLIAPLEIGSLSAVVLILCIPYWNRTNKT